MNKREADYRNFCTDSWAVLCEAHRARIEKYEAALQRIASGRHSELICWQIAKAALKQSSGGTST